MSRNGLLEGVTNSAGARKTATMVPIKISGPHATFQKVVHVSHSYGSFVTLGLITAHANRSDGAVATGGLPVPDVHSPGQTWSSAEYAPQNSEQLFGDVSSGYIVIGNPSAIRLGSSLLFATMRRASAVSSLTSWSMHSPSERRGV